MNLLLDTNIFLEIILDQEKASDARRLIEKAEEHNFYISDYSLHSIGVLLFRRNQHEVFDRFVDDLILTSNLLLAHLTPQELPAVSDVSQKYRLDFDDAYQYTLGEKHNLHVVSFDADFDRTQRKRKIPSELL